MGYKEPPPPQSQEEVDAEMMAQLQVFGANPAVQQSLLKGK